MKRSRFFLVLFVLFSLASTAVIGSQFAPSSLIAGAEPVGHDRKG